MTVFMQISRVTRVVQPSALSRMLLTPESCQLEKQKLWQTPNCPLHQLLGTEQEQPQHRDKCPHLVLHLSAVLGCSPTSQGLKDQGTYPVNFPVLLGLLTHPWDLQLAPCLGQRHQ